MQLSENQEDMFILEYNNQKMYGMRQSSHLNSDQSTVCTTCAERIYNPYPPLRQFHFLFHNCNGFYPLCDFLLFTSTR